ncbi:MAG: hypothetical protein ACOC3Z_01995 [Nanoarchaeota archaeon]
MKKEEKIEKILNNLINDFQIRIHPTCLFANRECVVEDNYCLNGEYKKCNMYKKLNEEYINKVKEAIRC